MKKIKFESAKKDLCVICGKHVEIANVYICVQCLKPCDIDDYRILDMTNGKMLVDVKSKCCNADIEFVGRLTCSEQCHEKFVKQLEIEFGKVKKVIDNVTGIAYRVSTRDLIEKGLTWRDLPKYPQWDDQKMG